MLVPRLMKQLDEANSPLEQSTRDQAIPRVTRLLDIFDDDDDGDGIPDDEDDDNAEDEEDEDGDCEEDDDCRFFEYCDDGSCRKKCITNKGCGVLQYREREMCQQPGVHRRRRLRGHGLLRQGEGAMSEAR